MQPVRPFPFRRLSQRSTPLKHQSLKEHVLKTFPPERRRFIPGPLEIKSHVELSSCRHFLNISLPTPLTSDLTRIFSHLRRNPLKLQCLVFHGLGGEILEHRGNWSHCHWKNWLPNSLTSFPGSRKSISSLVCTVRKLPHLCCFSEKGDDISNLQVYTGTYTQSCGKDDGHEYSKNL